MLVSTLLIIVIGVVAYFHWLQGLLSGFISAVLALFAAAIAVGYYEPLAKMLGGGKFNDQAHGVCLIALFALVYIVLRVVFDMLVPGNIRVPAIADKVGGAVFGVIAGLFAMGVVVIAMQYFPFGPSIGGYARFDLKPERSVTIPPTGNGPQINRMVYDELKPDNLDGPQSGLMLPADDLVAAMVGAWSDGGALDNGKPFKAIHPDLMQELAGQRLGYESGARHTATNKKGTQVRLEDERPIHILPSPMDQAPTEYDKIRPEPTGKLVAKPGKKLVAITVLFAADAADETEGQQRLVRLSPGAVRLCAKLKDHQWKNYFPLGTVQDKRAWINKPDDAIFINVGQEDRGAHFLFEVDESVVKPDKTGKLVNESAFLEVKRMVVLPLNDLKIATGLPAAKKKYYPMRKAKFFDEASIPDEGKPKPPDETTTPPDNTTKPPDNTTMPPDNTTKPPDNPPADNGWNDAPMEKPTFVASDKLPSPINVGSADADAMVDNAAMTAMVEGRKLKSLETKFADAGAAIATLSKGSQLVSQFAVAKDMRMIQVKLTLKKSADAWGWAGSVGDYSVSDGSGNSHKARGVWAVGSGKLAAKYDFEQADLGGITPGTGKVDSVTFLFVVPKDFKAKELQYQGKAGGLPLEK